MDRLFSNKKIGKAKKDVNGYGIGCRTCDGDCNGCVGTCSGGCYQNCGYSCAYNTH